MFDPLFDLLGRAERDNVTACVTAAKCNRKFAPCQLYGPHLVACSVATRECSVASAPASAGSLSALSVAAMATARARLRFSLLGAGAVSAKASEVSPGRPVEAFGRATASRRRR